MKLAIMQPYLFPYIGYFQLIDAVDKFILYDDVQFIKDGWINRNRILPNGHEKMFTIPLVKASYTDSICDRIIASDQWVKERTKLLTTIRQGYAKAPHFNQAMELIEPCLFYESKRLTEFIVNALRACCGFMGITTELILSSELSIAVDLRGQDRVVSICKQLGFDHYINAIGGKTLYDRANFESQGIRLSFLQTKDVQYSQFKNDFIPYLSIIDVMMFNSRDQVRDYLGMYDLV